MMENKHIALLRAINVGGHNIIKMTDLKSCFEKMGFEDVSTYIQSGNILFKTYENDIYKLTNKIEQIVSETFNYSSRIVIISHQQLKQIVDEAPHDFGKDVDRFRYDVLFLTEPLNSYELIKRVNTGQDVDTVYAGEKVLYFSRLINKVLQNHMPDIIAHDEEKYITVRNWNTTLKLCKLMEN